MEIQIRSQGGEQNQYKDLVNTLFYKKKCDFKWGFTEPCPEHENMIYLKRF